MVGPVYIVTHDKLGYDLCVCIARIKEQSAHISDLVD